jgi:hypothetical protein
MHAAFYAAAAVSFAAVLVSLVVRRGREVEGAAVHA